MSSRLQTGAWLPEVGFVGVSRCFYDTYDRFYTVCRDKLSLLYDYLIAHIQNSLLAVLLTVF